MAHTHTDNLLFIWLLASVLPLFAQEDTEHLTLLHTNDFHGNLEPNSLDQGGSSRIAWLVDTVRNASAAGHVLLLDAGDVFFAAPAISELVDGESTIDIYNMIEYNLAAIGNHEWDKGVEVLEERVAQSNFTWVSANLVINGTNWTNPSWVKPYKIFKIGTAFVGVIGLTTTETPAVSAKGVTAGFIFRGLLETVLHYYDEVYALSDIIIVLAHCGTADVVNNGGLITVAEGLSAAGKPVAVLIGGHTNEVIQPPMEVDGMYIVEAGCYGLYVGQLEIDIHPVKKTFNMTLGFLNPINGTTCGDDAAVAAEVEYWAELVEPLTEQVVALTYINLTRADNAECDMADLVSDSMLEVADYWDNFVYDNSIDISFMNPGGLRSDFYCMKTSCNVTWGDTFNILPFGNTLVVETLTGQQVKDILVQGASLSKGLAQVSYTVHYDWWNLGDTEYGVTNVTVKGVPLNLTASYVIVTNNFLAEGGDGWETFEQGTNAWDTYVIDQDALNEYLGVSSGPSLQGVILSSSIQSGRIRQLTTLPNSETSTSNVESVGDSQADSCRIAISASLVVMVLLVVVL